jgi:3-oxoacyl-[acyl-carrier-protein] synthase II
MGRERFWEALANGESGIGLIKRFDASDLPCQIAGELWDFNPEDFMKKSDVRHWNRHVHQAVACARMTVEDADFAAANYQPERVAVAFGTSVGTPDEAYQRHKDAFDSAGWKKVDKFASSAFAGHSATVHLTVNFGFRGPAITIASGCATGLDVLAWGVSQIRLGAADAALVGATECPLFPLGFAGACSLGILSKRNDDPRHAMRPYDRNSDGIVLSEGAAAVMIERAENAVARGAPILAEVAGSGSAAEGASPLILDKEGRGLARAIEMALADAAIAAEDVSAVHSHGVSLSMYDQSETRSLKRALGRHAHRVPISATKSMTGQAYSAGGMMGILASLLMINRGVVPPTLNLTDPYPECDLDYVPLTARINDVETALITSISFGGTHSATLIRRFN